MTDRMTTDSCRAAPLEGSDLDAAARPAAPAPAKKARKPRPTFEDGALTRTFKFPSKSYPRSSYYVTSTEIIIRIKKARKKWKMTIPKKRVVSYRTNRWFAKPRWIAIELTYTQAVKLGLAEARPRASEPALANSDALAPATMAGAVLLPGRDAVANTGADVVPNDHGAQDAPHVDAAPELSSAPRHQHEPALAVDDDAPEAADDLAEQDGDDHFELALDVDGPETEAYDTETGTDVEEPEPQGVPEVPAALLMPNATEPEPALPPPTQQEARPPVLLIAAPTVAAPAVSAPAVAARAPVRAPRPARHAIMTLAAALAGYAVWAAFDGTALSPTSQCGPPCSSPIVTGALGPPNAPQLPLQAPAIDPPLQPADIAAVVQTELAAQARADAAAPAPAVDDARETAPPEITARELAVVVLPEPALVLPLSPPLVTASVDIPQPVASPPPACDTLAATARDVRIHFDYARSQLDPSVLPGLDDVAALLRACADGRVLVEGHTDSDGRAASNRSLSLRRAQAVQKHLVAAGIAPERVEAVGFGQTRPALPNVSQSNKRNNRRVVLVVTAPR